MADYSSAAFDYAYEVDRTVELCLADGSTFRLEVVHRVKGYSGLDYEVRYFKQRKLYETPDGNAFGTQETPLGPSLDLWERDMSLPSAEAQSAELALSSALRWLAERLGDHA